MVTTASFQRSRFSLCAALGLLLGAACGPSPAVVAAPEPSASATAPGPVPEPAVVPASATATATASPVAAASASVSAAPATPSASAKLKGESYVACGCGCCGGVAPRQKCLYRSKGDDLAQIRAADEASRKNPECAMMGCFMGTEYSYCD